MIVHKNNFYFPTRRIIASVCAHDNILDIDKSERCFFVNYGRTGLSMALRALNLPPNSKVGLMMFNCHTVLNSIVSCRLSPVFIDVTNNFEIDYSDLQKKHNIKALVVTHLFGLPSDIDTVKEICPDIPIIEDCAHAFLSKDSKGVPLGTKGDFAVFSFGLGKFPSLGGGGVLIVNNPLYQSYIVSYFNALCAQKGFSQVKSICRCLAKSVLNSSSLLGRLVLHKHSDHCHLIHYDESKCPKFFYYCYLNDKVFFPKYVNQQQVNASAIIKELNTINGVCVPQIDILNNNCIMIPIIVEDRDLFLKFLHSHNIDTSPQYPDCLEYSLYFGYEPGTCPNSEELIKHNVIIPCHYNLTHRQIIKLLEVLTYYVQQR